MARNSFHSNFEAKKAISMFRHIFCQRRARLFVDGSMSPASVQTLLYCQPQSLMFIYRPPALLRSLDRDAFPIFHHCGPDSTPRRHDLKVVIDAAVARSIFVRILNGEGNAFTDSQLDIGPIQTYSAPTRINHFMTDRGYCK